MIMLCRFNFLTGSISCSIQQATLLCKGSVIHRVKKSPKFSLRLCLSKDGALSDILLVMDVTMVMRPVLLQELFSGLLATLLAIFLWIDR
jgi:hypothetical protein